MCVAALAITSLEKGFANGPEHSFVRAYACVYIHICMRVCVAVLAITNLEKGFANSPEN